MIQEGGKSGFKVLKFFIKKLRAHLQLSQSRRLQETHCHKSGEELKENAVVAEDVKEGHFPVFAVKSETPQRFIVELQFLTNPAFLRLLKQAEEEYGFSQKGVLAVPCSPEELQEILQEKMEVA